MLENIKKEIGTRKIAIYGKGGIGKSTTSSNLAAAMSVLGLNTMLVGCDPKADSIHSLIENKDKISTILDTIRTYGTSLESVESCIYRGFNDITCVESGGPAPGIGCAGKGVAVALELLKDHKFFHENLDVVLFDVLGDVVCGGFAQPMRDNFAKEVYVVTSGEYMSIYQAVNIASSIADMANNGIDVKMSGIICNKRNVVGEDEIVSRLSEIIEVPIIQYISRSPVVQEAESIGKTVIEAFGETEAANGYYDLARKVYANKNLVVPKVSNRMEILDEIKSIIRKVNNYEKSKSMLV
ncbi:MAG: P-loop NTPase [Clostridiaceae bacterium]